ncbi:MAG: M15 family metallopeptidase [Pseudohongiella sp.]|jgi:zinc D-Ala-D-Ala dipeptidase|nr:M15 family metallopeptidase [Pseudohongiella sp.]
MANKHNAIFSKLLWESAHLGIALALLLWKSLVAAEDIPDKFVDIQQAIPTISLEVRYFTTDNFVGARIDGYAAAKVYVTEATADALKRVQGELNNYGLGLRVFDGYRPQMAVDHFVRWAENLADTKMKQRYYPAVDKKNLFRDGYIAERSGHSRGSTLDLTLIAVDSGQELDMGTRWDFFDLKSWPSSTQVNGQQRANRLLLRRVMLRQGFRPLQQEWWHFTLENEPFPDTYFEFQIR